MVSTNFSQSSTFIFILADKGERINGRDGGKKTIARNIFLGSLVVRDSKAQQYVYWYMFLIVTSANFHGVNTLKGAIFR